MARILIIDDDDQIRTLFGMALERAGHSVELAENGIAGLESFRAHPADIVVTDIIMPEKEGLEMIIELRREYPNVKIIAISGGGRVPPRVYLDSANLLGAQRSFAKPVDIGTLVQAINELLTGG